MRASAFWDSSALVPLFVRQTITARARSWYKNFEIVTWWATPVEMASALARLLRMKELTPAEWMKARKSIVELAETFFVIPPNAALKVKAIELVEQYDLRAADSLQLAAALAWCEEAPQGRKFLTADERLRQAATLAGFDT